MIAGSAPGLFAIQQQSCAQGPAALEQPGGKQKEWTKKWFARLNWSASQQHSRQIGCETLVLLSFSTNTRDIEADRTGLWVSTHQLTKPNGS